ncbi:hypothetical protein OPV22_007844 [Ensete ventricosum]|uniref:HIT-type domain-containing protein n=1 Tax=Ensete ventricosum TaxID=4639 RepID=A0AAV8RAY6_ENSVE|nr:hypothetical protein OPV22_007844 [Ensete ventricosum]
MGNRISGSRRRPVEERLTRPQRILRQPTDVDYKKLRKLILARKLAPCFDPLDELPHHPRDLEECPICFFYYPSLNRSRCCSKGICTECFLQMKPSDASRPVQYPILSSSSCAVVLLLPALLSSILEYRGARTEEEKDQERAEEQKVTEAKLRTQHESQIVGQVIPSDAQNIREMSERGTSLMQGNVGLDGPFRTCNNRNGNLSVNLEEVMVMEAIWHSLQDSRLQKSAENQIYGSSNMIGFGNAAHEIDDATCLQSSGEVSSTGTMPMEAAVAISRLPDQNLLQAHHTKPDCESQAKLKKPHGSSAEESNTRSATVGVKVAVIWTSLSLHLEKPQFVRAVILRNGICEVVSVLVVLNCCSGQYFHQKTNLLVLVLLSGKATGNIAWALMWKLFGLVLL